MAMPFAFPVVWRKLSNHISDCYFCLTPLVASGMNRKKQRFVYVNIPSAIRSVPHWKRSIRARATKRIKFEFGGGRGRHGENRISRRRSYRSRLPRSSI
jgi:hypothetical protein